MKLHPEGRKIAQEIKKRDEQQKQTKEEEKSDNQPKAQEPMDRTDKVKFYPMVELTLQGYQQ